MQKLTIALAAALTVGAGAALAQSGVTSAGLPDPRATISDRMQTPAERQAVEPTGGTGGSNSAKVQVVNLIGGPSKPGMYAQQLKVAPHVSIASHHHTRDRTASVLQGPNIFGYGPTFDRAKPEMLPTGSVYAEPAGSPHYAVTGDAPAVALITGFGPTDTVYEDPANDPTEKDGDK